MATQDQIIDGWIYDPPVSGQLHTSTSLIIFVTWLRAFFLYVCIVSKHRTDLEVSFKSTTFSTRGERVIESLVLMNGSINPSERYYDHFVVHIKGKLVISYLIYPETV